MTQTTTIDGTSRTAVIPRKDAEWADSAYLGEVGAGRFVIDDDSGNISVVGHKTIDTEQTACSSWPTLFMGFVGRKTFARGTKYDTGAGREITVETTDGNDLLSRRVMTATSGSDKAKRPSESVSARITWLLATSYVSGVINDYGQVTYPSDVMDANDFTGQRPGDVLADCAKKMNFNYFVRWSYTNSGWELVFRDDNTSTADTSTISITNDGTADGVSSFAPFQDAALTQDPQDVYSGVDAGYARGRKYLTRAATASAFVTRDGTTDDTGIKTLAEDIAQGNAFLFRSRSELFSLTLTIRMRAAYVNLIRAGMRVPVTLTHYTQEGFGGVTYWRVIRRRVRQPLDTDNDYDVQLDLSNPEPPCSGTPAVVQWNYADATSVASLTTRQTLSAASTAGNLLVLAMEYSGSFIGAATVPTGWSSAVLNTSLVSGDPTSTTCNIFYKTSVGETSVDVTFASITSGVPRYVFMELSGLANPVLNTAATILRVGSLGYAEVPATTYPSASAAVVAICFMHGPEDPDVLQASGTGMSLLIPWNGAWDFTLINPGIGVGGLLNGTAGVGGTTPLYPAAGGWRFLFTNLHPTLTAGLVFTGDSC